MGDRKQLYLGSSVGTSAYTHAYSGFMSGSASIPVHALPPRRSLIFPKAALALGNFFLRFQKRFLPPSAVLKSILAAKPINCFQNARICSQNCKTCYNVAYRVTKILFNLSCFLLFFVG